MISIIHVFIFIFGTCIGSFLNAVIYRLPRGINIVHPRSSCPNCNKVILWYENIPFFSFLFLRGKCSECNTSISLRYPIVELFTGVFSLVVFHFNGISFEYFFYFFIGCIFIAHFLIDIDFQLLPDSLNLILGLLFLINTVIYSKYINTLWGGVVGFTVPFSVTWIFYKIKGKIGLGGGDIKLFAVLGLYLGPFHIMQTIFLSCFLGSLVGIGLIILGKMSKENPMPFGPMIIIVATIQIYLPLFYKSYLSIFSF